ncbi:SMP-30/gluconolactonase/LRE family protein [Microbispora sp. RL4-1S]|uniref:SMP-30/gluconolactonase/LRE family protein n=1 Tax=Microbispora oryzae TaxID=2806554 RepID=A0A940WI28_9ACTN|nr:SMP-30/gluconolactonase/LRE family protein [Microbispora oryzae]MBP2705916.1 SMP-30/gluconolactonase/LRE family protein [Microbispora oryzae]
MNVWCPDSCELGEGARWARGRLIFVDILAGRLLAAPTGGPGPAEELARVDVPLGAVAPVAGAPTRWLAAAGRGIALLDHASGTLDWIARLLPATSRMNDGVCDPAGRFWAGSMDYDAVKGAGVLYRVDRDLTVTVVRSGLTIPNGPAFTADGRTMYLADTGEGRIDRHPVDPVTGDLGAPSVFARIAGGVPDGMTVDDEGHLWVAVWGASAVHRYAPDGRLDRVVPVPTPQPTSVCLAGGRLYVTTAAHGLAPVPRGAGALHALPTSSQAPPTPLFALG